MKPLGRLKSRNSKLVAILVLLVVLYASGAMAPINRFVSSVFTPVLSPLQAAGRSVGGWLDPGGDEQLEAELLQLRNQRSREQLQFENEQLRAQLNFATQTNLEFKGAEVIGYQPDSLRAGVTINRGAKDGLEPGMAVVSRGFLVGKVEQVGSHRSTVILLTDPNFRLQAISRQHRARGILAGQVGATVSLTSIVQNDRVESGDTVVTSGSAGEFPANITIGEVTTVEPKAGTVFKIAQVKPGSSLRDLAFLLVITGGY